MSARFFSPAAREREHARAAVTVTTLDDIGALSVVFEPAGQRTDGVVLADDLRALAACANVELELVSCALADSAAHDALAQLRSLRSIGLHLCSFDASSAALFDALRDADSVQYMSISLTTIADDDACATTASLARFVAASRSLAWIDLYCRDMFDDALYATWRSPELVRALGACASLTKLCFHVFGALDDELLHELVDEMRHTSRTGLRAISLLWCDASEAVLGQLVRALPVVESFELAHSNLPDFSARSFVALVEQASTLTSLALNSLLDAPQCCQLLDELSSSRAASRLLTLELDARNPRTAMNDELAARIVDLVANPRLRLRSLSLADWSLSAAQVAAVLAAADQSSRLTQLSLEELPPNDVLSANDAAQWHRVCGALADAALGLAALELPAYVVLDIVDNISPALARCRHGAKIRALVLVLDAARRKEKEQR